MGSQHPTVYSHLLELISILVYSMVEYFYKSVILSVAREEKPASSSQDIRVCKKICCQRNAPEPAPQNPQPVTGPQEASTTAARPSTATRQQIVTAQTSTRKRPSPQHNATRSKRTRRKDPPVYPQQQQPTRQQTIQQTRQQTRFFQEIHCRDSRKCKERTRESAKRLEHKVTMRQNQALM